MVSAAAGFPAFAVACGEEASDPVVVHQGQDVRVDQLGASGHLDRQDDDLAAVAGLGVRWWRYGMPWRLVELGPGRYDWTLWDRALAACERRPRPRWTRHRTSRLMPGAVGDVPALTRGRRYSCRLAVCAGSGRCGLRGRCRGGPVTATETAGADGRADRATKGADR